MKNINPLGLIDDHFLMEKLTKLGDPLQKLNEYIDWVNKAKIGMMNLTYNICRCLSLSQLQGNQ